MLVNTAPGVWNQILETCQERISNHQNSGPYGWMTIPLKLSKILMKLWSRQPELGAKGPEVKSAVLDISVRGAIYLNVVLRG